MSVLDFQFEQGSVQAYADHLEQTRINILAAVRFGMMEGMEGLAVGVAEKLQGNPIASRTGDLLATVLNSPRVVETDSYIKGEVSTASARFRNLGLWLEYGTKYPTKGRGLSAYPKQFLPGTPESARTLGHGAFRIEPKPFFNPTFLDYYPTILDLIAERVSEACDATSI